MAGTEVVIASAVRTPIGRFKGAFQQTPAPRLAAVAIAAAIERAAVRPSEVSEAYIGHVVQAGTYQAPARQATLFAGIPPSVGATTINRVCGSGMEAMIQGVRAIREDPSRIIIAGGMENMTMAPYLMPQARMGASLGHAQILDSLVTDGLWDVHNDVIMGTAGELMAKRLHLSREQVDDFAARSHTLAAKATASGRFSKEIVPVDLTGSKGKLTTVSDDEGIRADTSVESLARLRPAFADDGVLTAGNSSQISDGAAATVLMSRASAHRRGIDPLATIVDYDQQAVPPEEVMFAPIPCVRKLCARTSLRIDDFDLIEHNEAFSTASVGVRQELGIPWEVFNIHGGAVALGHPIGCSGARIVVTLLHSMVDKHAHRGLATLCIGGGDSLAMVLER